MQIFGTVHKPLWTKAQRQKSPEDKALHNEIVLQSYYIFYILMVKLRMSLRKQYLKKNMIKFCLKYLKDMIRFD
jgi:hypothetical protein